MHTGPLVEDEVDELQGDGQLLRVDGAVQQEQLRELRQAAAMALYALRTGRIVVSTCGVSPANFVRLLRWWYSYVRS